MPAAVKIDKNPVDEDEAAVIDVEVGPVSHHERSISADQWNAK